MYDNDAAATFSHVRVVFNHTVLLVRHERPLACARKRLQRGNGLKRKHSIWTADEIMDDDHVITCLDKVTQSAGCPCVGFSSSRNVH